MFNTTQAFIKLTNANIKAYSLLIRSPEISKAKTGADSSLQTAEGGFLAYTANSEALSQWSQTTMKNYVIFGNEVSQGLMGMVQQGQVFLTDETKAMSEDYQQSLKK